MICFKLITIICTSIKIVKNFIKLNLKNRIFNDTRNIHKNNLYNTVYENNFKYTIKIQYYSILFQFHDKSKILNYLKNIQLGILNINWNL